ncbi:Stf0 family sulfotransferase [Mesorhizobium sp. VK25A]|uniref:Stf0 family sulfotransferase n=1 Tax=Mesorhizobium vachelliae TaxID=3072309 RepID=A0ABU5A3L1_9HYPH|nr:MULTISPECIES: Stf0 family sulfotransferase [unclassified Mesorhizobium]MDX8531114.1 Stf0 family sulfotransferase [Mesorhizobium sp. VK25D]MDX8543135.1 Stf0 family sulfotransferase [Mesorhizobium sp. VK25A]
MESVDHFQVAAAQKIVEGLHVLRGLLDKIEHSYSIAFTPRCGSNHLCDLLTLAGIGRPTEYFQYELPHWKVADLNAAISTVLRENTVNGVFGVKIAHDHCAWLRSAIARATGQDRTLGDVFPNHRWIRLVRRDKIAQAISLYRAQVTQQWLIWQDDSKSNVTVPYDFPAIVTCYHTVLTAELAWDVYFSEHRIEPLVIIYEELVERPHETVSAIAEYLSLKNWHSDKRAEANLRIQRDEHTASLIAQFRHTLIDIGSLQG